MNEKPDPNQISIAELKSCLDRGGDMLVLDVRHDDDCERYRSRIAGSHLSARLTLAELGIPRTTFYRWYDR